MGVGRVGVGRVGVGWQQAARTAGGVEGDGQQHHMRCLRRATVLVVIEARRHERAHLRCRGAEVQGCSGAGAACRRVGGAAGHRGGEAAHQPKRVELAIASAPRARKLRGHILPRGDAIAQVAPPRV